MKTQDFDGEILAMAVDHFHDALRNRMALIQQIERDLESQSARLFTVPDIDTQAIDNATYSIEKAFRQVCIAARWSPFEVNTKREAAMGKILQELKTMEWGKLEE
jgi:hypothetical protein